MRKTPFWLNPRNWFLVGAAKEEARVIHNATSEYEKELGLIKLRSITETQAQVGIIELDFKHGKISEYEKTASVTKAMTSVLPSKDQEMAMLEVDYRFNMISDKEFDVARVNLSHPEDTTEKMLLLLEIKQRYGEVTDKEYDKEKATLLKEPWVDVDVNVDPDSPQVGTFRFDWNKIFIMSLEDAGYVAPNEIEVVQLWFNELCKNVALEVFDGVGDFSDRVLEPEEARIEKMKVFKRAEAEKATKDARRAKRESSE